ncbi:MAG: hypothetical protein FWF22_05775 [Treponema sp.]|nr:hypothetical protein [Treponema sp.]
MKKFFFLYFLCAFTIFLSAQTADKLEELLNTPAVSYEQAAWLALEAADVWDQSGAGIVPDPHEAFVVAQQQQWLPDGIDSAAFARLDAVSLLLMRSFGLDGGIFYSLFKNPHYAYRELVYQEIIAGVSDPAMNVSGSTLVFMVNGILAKLEGTNWSPVISVQPKGTEN